MSRQCVGRETGQHGSQEAGLQQPREQLPAQPSCPGPQRRERRSPATGGGTGELVMAVVGSGRQRLFSQ